MLGWGTRGVSLSAVQGGGSPSCNCHPTRPQPWRVEAGKQLEGAGPKGTSAPGSRTLALHPRSRWIGSRRAAPTSLRPDARQV